MRAEQIKLVQTSLFLIEPKASEAAILLYARLFDLEASLESLFRVDLKRQGQHFMAVLGAAVDSLENMDEMTPYLRELGRRHVAYGVRAEHYALVGDALLDVLPLILGRAFTPALRDAWREAYQVVAEPMAAAAQEAAFGNSALLMPR